MNKFIFQVIRSRSHLDIIRNFWVKMFYVELSLNLALHCRWWRPWKLFVCFLFFFLEYGNCIVNHGVLPEMLAGFVVKKRNKLPTNSSPGAGMRKNTVLSNMIESKGIRTNGTDIDCTWHTVLHGQCCRLFQHLSTSILSTLIVTETIKEKQKGNSPCSTTTTTTIEQPKTGPIYFPVTQAENLMASQTVLGAPAQTH